MSAQVSRILSRFAALIPAVRGLGSTLLWSSRHARGGCRHWAIGQCVHPRRLTSTLPISLQSCPRYKSSPNSLSAMIFTYIDLSITSATYISRYRRHAQKHRPHRPSQMVQRSQRLRLHKSRRRRQGCIRSLQRHSGSTFGVEVMTRRLTPSKGSGSKTLPEGRYVQYDVVQGLHNEPAAVNVRTV